MRCLGGIVGGQDTGPQRELCKVSAVRRGFVLGPGERSGSFFYAFSSFREAAMT